MEHEISMRLRWVRMYHETSDAGLVCTRCGISRPTLRKLVARGKNANIAVVAVARELTGFIWDIGRLSISLAVPGGAQGGNTAGSPCRPLQNSNPKEFPEGGVARHPSNPRPGCATDVIRFAASDSGRLIGRNGMNASTLAGEEMQEGGSSRADGIKVPKVGDHDDFPRQSGLYRHRPQAAHEYCRPVGHDIRDQGRAEM